MDFSYSEEQLITRDAILRIAESLDDSHTAPLNTNFPISNWKKLADQGLLGLTIPEKFGGGSLDCLSAAIVLETLGYACSDHGLVHAVCIQNLCAIHIDKYGDEGQKANYLPQLCSGQMIAAQAITEPGAGSDAGAIVTKAEKTENGYTLNGSKVYISNGPIADLIIVHAVTSPERKVLGRTSCFIVAGNAPGLDKGKAMEKMGLDSLQNGELFFSDCEVPTGALLGKEGRGSAMFSDGMNWERVLLFASFVGKLERIIDRCVSQARERKQFGSPIGSFQMVSSKIANMKVNYELARLVTYKAAWLIDSGKSPTMEAAICKLFASESCKAACLDAVQIHGGYGYMKEADIERELRDSIAGTIYSGTSEVQRIIIARLCGV